jgi:hypothetical protein
MKLATKMATALAALVLSGAAQADLFDRGGGLVYDNDRNVTWLFDMNYAKTSGFDADGLMTWYVAAAWVDSLTYGGFSDWRLPTASLKPDGSGPCIGVSFVNCADGELAHLFFNELGVTPGTSTLTANPAKLALFANVLPTAGYWTGYAVGNPTFFSTQVQGDLPSRGPIRFTNGLPVVVVRDGDVSPVPEPTGAAMMLLGVGVLMLAVRRQKA